MSASNPTPDRISSGNPQADAVLGGGFPANSINILMGEPGTGKTLFAEQLLFANAAGERPVLYLTTLSEPLSKVVTYLQLMPFYDESKLGTAVLYDDIGALLAREGVASLIPRLREASRPRHRASSSSTRSRPSTTCPHRWPRCGASSPTWPGC